MSKKVRVKSLTNGTVVINVPDLRLRRIWERKGAVKVIDDEILQEAIYDPGVEFLFKQGLLQIEDTEVAKEIDPELENVKILDEAQMRGMLKGKPLAEFKEKVEELPQEQVYALIEYAIQNEIIDMAKIDYLKKKTGIDITKAVQLKRQQNEKVETEE